MLTNHDLNKRLRIKVQNTGKFGVSSSLKNSTHTRRKAPFAKTIEGSFELMNRDVADVKVVKALCANGIPFSVLRNPERNMEKDLTPVKDTWYHHEVSIVSDGWTNVKKQPLINIIAANTRSAMFLYAEDF